ncbi:Cobyric acid synthase [Alkalidesulfovibrio alkalitolerans DSM 16529]|jgi:cobyric acid synthase CobQ/L-threonine-O-3-phosphate decarboxylase|uniref:Cobyric acid synthase n=2 Tax=Alkalidesulfovibrio alkalitolerans TaxID=293256 RepID=S7TH08_9BACT|nr:Cobyric acid synthase [Alkalidesulfovibrio alkalitolerans DSM 16529]
MQGARRIQARRVLPIREGLDFLQQRSRWRFFSGLGLLSKHPSRYHPRMPEHSFSHGGHIRALAQRAGRNPSEILDFSASINPLGPPAWLRSVVAGSLSQAVHYPDPEALTLREAAAALHGGGAEEYLAGNGVSDILYVLPRLGGHARAVIPVPAYGDYERAARLAGLDVTHVPLSAGNGFRLDPGLIEKALANGPAMVFLGQPNNPTGTSVPPGELARLAQAHPDSLFVIDEAFADFTADLPRLAGQRPENMVVLLSLTKIFAVPGLRLGLAAAAPGLIRKLADISPPWQCSTIAQAVGARALADLEFQQRSRTVAQEFKAHLLGLLAAFPEIEVFAGEANFVLCRLNAPGLDGRDLAERLLQHGIAIRACDTFAGLDASWFRLAVRQKAENERLAEALGKVFRPAARARAARARRTPAIMVQGTCSNAGKSVLAAGLCRIFARKGLSPCPFKAQNMSLNSFVTMDGGEMGRAQVTQALAAGREPEARMNPVLLKPSSDTGSQVIVLGRPVGVMRVAQYVAYKPTAFAAARAAYDELAATAGVMVVEGAGSPAEVNLKAHDIVNMAMARHAGARVLLVADIDRGGSFASLAGTMDCLEEWERALVAGFVLNKFRGDASLLAGGFDFLRLHTGREVLGVVPWLPGLGLPEEDSVSFKQGLTLAGKEGAALDVAVADLAHISNFTDLDALAAEPDVRLRRVARGRDLGRPDCVILPGSKNTLADLDRLRESGLAGAVAALRGQTVIVGICGGFQMLGQSVADPLGLESARGVSPGLGLLDVRTVLAAEKTLARRLVTDLTTGCAVTGYEIHHGETVLGETASGGTAPDGGASRPLYAEDAGLGRVSADGLTLGTYLHGVFDADGHRHAFLDFLRRRKGLAPLPAGARAAFGLDAALDRLADALESSLDMQRIEGMLGI